MCGFAAFFSEGRDFRNDFLDHVERDLFHRGPDSGGRYVEKGIALVFRRLSIHDLSDKASQPMTDKNHRATIVFNGEIYNFLDLRKKLQSKGVTFITNGDTEVLLQGYLLWGEKVLDQIEGMFTFVIVDHERKEVLVARDPFGIKPLYMTCLNGVIAFSSEMKSLRRVVGTSVNHASLSELLTFGWASGRLSNLDNIEKVLGGELIKFSLIDQIIKRRMYCDTLDTLKPDYSINEKNVIDIVGDALHRSIKQHTTSDVGYTMQLSGGVDSSLIAAILSKGVTGNHIHAYGARIKDYVGDEKVYRDMVCNRYNINQHEVNLSNADFADNFEKAVSHMEGPVPHLGCVFLMLTSFQAKKSSKVMLTGEGADEMFGGYQRYQLWKKIFMQEKLSKLIPLGLLPSTQPFLGIKKLKNKDAVVYSSVYKNLENDYKYFPDLIPRSGYRNDISSKYDDFRSRLLAVDQKTYMESLLMRQDKMSMAASVESRTPFVHYPLAKIINTIPNHVRIPGKVTKPILKKFSEKYLPHDLIYRRKNGLLLPYNDWLKDETGLGRFLDLIASNDCRLADYAADKNVLPAVVREFKNNNIGIIPSMVHLVNIELWLRSLNDGIREGDMFVN